MMMRYIFSLKVFLVFAIFQFHLYAQQLPIGDLQLAKDSNGITARTLLDNGNKSSMDSLDDNTILGFINLKYQKGNTRDDTISTRGLRANVITTKPNQITIL